MVSSKPDKKRFSLGTTFILVVGAVLSVAMGISIYINDTHQRDVFLKQITSKGEALVSFTALISSDAVLGNDYLLLNQYMREISHQQDIVYGVITAADGKNLTAYLNNENSMVQQYRDSDFSRTINNINSDPHILTLHHPIDAGGKIGSVILAISTKRANDLAHEAMLNQLAQGGIILLMLSLIIYLIFRSRTLRPIQALIQNTRHVMNGNLEHKAAIPDSYELAELAESFNRMTEVLAASNTSKDQAMEMIKQANKDLQAATKAKSAFLANMSHEIRTPLTAIIGFGETIMDADTTPSEQFDATQSIIRNGIHLQGVINDILDLSKIEAEKLEIETIEVPLFELLADIDSLIEIQAQEKGINAGINYRFPIPEKINTDPVRLKQILINLCNNAIKFTPKGSVRLEVGYDNLKQLMQFDIVDTGIGLTEEQQENIFDPFTQADSSTTRQYGGTGLGLPLSRQLAEMLGGGISVSSKPGIGSRFTVVIKAGAMAQDELIHELPGIRKIVTPQQQTESVKLDGHILLAEDTPDNQKLISIYIRHAGARVTVADNGKKAIDAAMQNHFDLILMDMQMPVMDGIEAIKYLRGHNYTGPIIALTANAMKEDRDRCLNAGCDDFLTKPIDRKKFYEVLGQYLQKNAHCVDVKKIILPEIDDEVDLFDIIESFITQLPGTQHSINHAFESRDWTTISQLLHDLKSTGGGLGYPVITEICHDIELKIHNITNTASRDNRAEDDHHTITIISSLIKTLHSLCESIINGWNETYHNTAQTKVTPIDMIDDKQKVAGKINPNT